MSERALPGVAAAPGIAVGTAWCPDRELAGSRPPGSPEQERDRATAALTQAAAALVELADGLPPEEAEILRAGALMAEDPALLASVETAVLGDALAAPEAIRRATEEYATAIARVGDETLAARAADVRSLGRRAARLAADHAAPSPPGRNLVLVAQDLGPADVAEAAEFLSGVALASGGPTAHAAIVARSLGIPMVTGLGAAALRLAGSGVVVVDGTDGLVIACPSAERVRRASAEMRARASALEAAHARRDQPAVTRDGRRITVLVNVATPEEVAAGLRAGAEGVGLLRTELAFLDAEAWPSEQEHTRMLRPILDALDGRPAVVRVLDFGADKAPPFLRGTSARGIELLLTHPEPFTWQLRAILLASQNHDVRILLPMVETPAQLSESHALIDHATRSLGLARTPPTGPMIETPAAAHNVLTFARHSDFLSIGTNDLTASTLGVARFAENSARAHDPKVLRAIAGSVSAAHEAGIPIEVCGEAASDPVMVPLLVGAGVDQLSVGAARLGEVRGWVRQLDSRHASGLLGTALAMESSDEVERAVRSAVGELSRPAAEPRLLAQL